ncbi:iron-containing alcohol dehydrogenase [Roseateles terrae]|uniref:Alcohol dehydrogenase class IV n=1 Tax=Roseateles terrae TaxID=431060 RepID=A0ABR6GNR1_9BURK|nr:iron-containing alcohol dehydrogenase [Roseateles terrae]MBB3193740.1 alcohol dehydrogenase class IV [Roseateles terrae]OWQ89106.1 4-hydroxybutyrate dehydrogenase [Roseateles terrae]
MALIQYLTHVHMEAGARRLLGAECTRVGIRRPLVVTDAGVRAAGVLDQALEHGPQPAPPVFDRTPPNPTEAAVREAAALYREHQCDGLIAIGGGSSIDLAKGVAIAATHEGPLTRYATIEGGAGQITARAAPLIAVPTTAGTGSEVARGAILIVDDGRKLGFHNWELLPKSAICDPELTRRLPPGLTAATGMDAIAHCMETFMSAAFNPAADGIALEGLRRGWRQVERATRHGDDMDARLDLMAASTLGALAFQKGLGCVHSLSHALGGLMPTLHHGTLNAVFLPAVIRFNAEHESLRREDKIARMAHAMGLQEGVTADELAAAVQAMTARLGLPTRLAEMGVTADLYDPVIARAERDHCHKTNPREASTSDYRRMLEASM